MSNQRQVRLSSVRRLPRDRRRRAFWFAPLTAGVALILMGVLIYVYPALLAYIVSFAFVFAGLTLLVVGLQMKSRIVYRRVDFSSGPADPPG